MKPAEWNVVVWDDIGYTIRMKAESHSATFEVFSVVRLDGWDNDVPTYPKKGWRSLPQDETSDLSKAEPSATGFIKWDGCCSVHVTDQSGGHHVCGRANMGKLATALNRIYDVAAETIPNWDAKVAG